MNLNEKLMTPANIPTSWAGLALKWGCEQDFLHPPNAGQTFLSKTVGWAVVRPILRLIYGIGVGILIAPLGVAYHFGGAIGCALQSKKERAWEHLNSAGFDFFAVFMAGSVLGLGLGLAYSVGGDNPGFKAGHGPFLIGSLYITPFFLFQETLVKTKEFAYPISYCNYVAHCLNSRL